MHQIPDCTHLSGISMVLFSFHQIEKNNVCLIICVFHGIEYCGIWRYSYRGKNFGQNWHKLLGRPYFFILMKWKQYCRNSRWMGTVCNLTHEPCGWKTFTGPQVQSPEGQSFEFESCVGHWNPSTSLEVVTILFKFRIRIKPDLYLVSWVCNRDTSPGSPRATPRPLCT